ncbi:hypothetical protein [Methylomonas sp. ZR1]|uniref:hypothetical protein n=1 Tax=Methylomonas sp. ZR1 TaxID=1797072 RepID=UPI0014913B5E|nr:hypothetical protein [Methylomonas sp. ZR1]NOV29674.1 hypothetical protein [Methylomonas sp. ZR1]
MRSNVFVFTFGFLEVFGLKIFEEKHIFNAAADINNGTLISHLWPDSKLKILENGALVRFKSIVINNMEYRTITYYKFCKDSDNRDAFFGCGIAYIRDKFTIDVRRCILQLNSINTSLSNQLNQQLFFEREPISRTDILDELMSIVNSQKTLETRSYSNEAILLDIEGDSENRNIFNELDLLNYFSSCSQEIYLALKNIEYKYQNSSIEELKELLKNTGKKLDTSEPGHQEDKYRSRSNNIIPKIRSLKQRLSINLILNLIIFAIGLLSALIFLNTIEIKKEISNICAPQNSDKKAEEPPNDINNNPFNQPKLSGISDLKVKRAKLINDLNEINEQINNLTNNSN